MREFSIAAGKVIARCSREECRAIVDHGEEVTAAQPKATPKRKPATESFDVIKAAKQRLRFLKGEIRTLRKLEKELAQLERLIGAAERPLASVSTLKSKTKSTL